MSTLIVIDIDSLNPVTRRDLLLDRDATYEGPFTSEALSHLAYLARERETRDAEKWAAMIGADASAPLGGAA